MRFAFPFLERAPWWSEHEVRGWGYPFEWGGGRETASTITRKISSKINYFIFIEKD